jgi:hypothetical protein
VVARRSAPASRLIILYHRPALILWIVGAIVRRLGEPLKSSFTPDAMRSLLEGYGFRVTSDRDLSALARDVSEELGRGTRHMKHARMVIAESGR